MIPKNKIVIIMAVLLLFIGTSCSMIDVLINFEVKKTTPANDKENVAVDAQIKVYFTKGVAPQSVDEQKVSIISSFGHKVYTNISFETENNQSLEKSVMVITPLTSLDPSTSYNVKIEQAVFDINGQTLDTSYTFTFTTSGNSEEEPNNVHYYANAITSGSIFVGTIESENDMDVYSIDVPTGKLLSIELFNNLLSGGIVDLTYEVFTMRLNPNTNQNEEVLFHTNSDMNGDLPPFPTKLVGIYGYPKGTSETFYIRVYDYGTNNFDIRNLYFLKAVLIDNPDTHESNGNGLNDAQNAVGASPLTSGTQVIGYIQNIMDEDWYKLSAAPSVNSVLYLSLDTKTGGTTNTAVDYSLSLHTLDQTGNTLTPVRTLQDTNGSDGYTILETIPVALEANTTQDYYIQVLDIGNDNFDAEGAYYLKAELYPEPDPNEPNGNKPTNATTLAAAKQLTNGTATTLYISFEGDEDWFYIDGVLNMATDIQITNSVFGTPVDINVEVFTSTLDANGYPVPIYDGSSNPITLTRTDGSSSPTSESRRITITTGRAYFRVTDLGNNDFDIDTPYTFRVSF